MAATFKLEIATPERMMVSSDATKAQIPGEGGYLGILPGHAPLISALQPGELSYEHDGHTLRMAVSWGFVEVLQTKVTVVVETAEKSEEIDVARAEKSRQRAEERLKKAATDIDLARAQGSFQRSLARLQVTGRR
jgi:F-type H+-transporting ATPase subunit epsilon